MNREISKKKIYVNFSFFQLIVPLNDPICNWTLNTHYMLLKVSVRYFFEGLTMDIPLLVHAGSTHASESHGSIGARQNLSETLNSAGIQKRRSPAFSKNIENFEVKKLAFFERKSFKWWEYHTVFPFPLACFSLFQTLVQRAVFNFFTQFINYLCIAVYIFSSCI